MTTLDFIRSNKTLQNIWVLILIYIIAFYWKHYPVVTNGLLVIAMFILFGRWKELGLLRMHFTWKTLGLALVLAVGLNLVAKLFLVPLSDYITSTERDLTRFEHLRDNPIAMLKFLPYIWASAAFGEEMIFRGFMLKQFPFIQFNKKLSPYWGLIASSILFGVGHCYQGPAGMVFTGMMGVFLGLVFIRSGFNLLLCMLVHGFFDTISGFMFVLKWDLYFTELW